MICPHCQSENKDTAKFCNECGFPLTGLIAQNEAANAAASTERDSDLDDGESARDDESAHGEGVSSGQQDRSEQYAVVLPEIDVQGLNVDEDGRHFASDGAPIDEVDESEDAPCNEDERSDRGTSGLDVEADDGFDFEPLSEGDYASPDSLSYEDSVDAADASRPVESPGSAETAVLQPIQHAGDGDLWHGGVTMEMPRVDEDRSTFGGYRAPEGSPDGGKKHRGRTAALVAVLVIVVAAAVAFGTYALELWGGKAVPDVENMTAADARLTLENAGFTVKSMDALSDGTEGLVLLTDPSAGSRIEEGSQVVIHVSVARTVPEVVGLSQEEALASLDDAGYTHVAVTTEKSNETEGSVISVSPEEGTKASSTAQVSLVVAEPYIVPDVLKKDAQTAQAELENEGYVVSVANYYTEDQTEGTVVSTDPAGGTKLNSGETVTMYVAVSRATELVNATYGIIYQGQNLVIDGVNYTVNSLDAVSYQGSDTVAYTFTGTPYTYFLGIRVELDPTTVSGTITFGSDNTVQSGSPSFKIAQ